MRAWLPVLLLPVALVGCSKSRAEIHTDARAVQIAKLGEQACKDPARPSLEAKVPGGGRHVWLFPDGKMSLGSWQRPCSHALGKCLCDLVVVPR